MLTSLARTLIGLSLATAGLSLFITEWVSVGLVMAGMMALGGVWLLSHRPAVPEMSSDILPRGPDMDDPLLELLWRSTQQLGQANSLDRALLLTKRLLEEELGATGVRVMRVDPLAHHPSADLPASPDLVISVRVIEPVYADIEGYRPTPTLVPMSRYPLGLAVDQRKVLGDPGQGYAVPVVHEGQVVAVLELHHTTLACSPSALRRLLEILGESLTQCHRRLLSTASSGALFADAETPGQARLGEQVQALPVAVFLFDADHLRLLDINRAAQQQFSLVPDRVVGQVLRDAFHPSLAAVAEPAMRRLITESAQPPNTESLHLGGAPSITCDYDWSPDPCVAERARTVQVHNVVLRDESGRPQWLLAMARDVSEERRAQRELAESQAVLHQLADTVEDSLFVTNPERTRFHFLAGSLFDVLGITRGQLLAQPACLRDLILEEDHDVITQRQLKEQALQAADVSFRIHHPVKGLRWLRSRTRTLRDVDGDLRVYGTLSDVTEDRLREEELRKARDAAEAASMAKSQFLANMSHEIRTPMNGILGMTELLLGTPLQDKQKRFAQAVYRSGESLLEIINDILDFSKIEAGKLELAPIDFSLRGLVEDTLELLAPRAHEKGLDISFREEPGLPAAAHGDALRLRQVLTNLVANAIKFTQTGEIVVELRHVPEGLEGAAAADLWMEFCISDTGIGIEADKLPHLFTAFTQVSSDMSRRYGGTGLGLAISKQLIELMGGQAKVQSSPGQGSRFSFTVPLQAAVSQQLNTLSDDAQMPALRVLVVDDHATNRIVLKNMLGAWGMSVVLAEDGQQALEMLSDPEGAESAFDLALVDMNMPRLDGMALAQAIQAQGRHAEMRMVLLSSMSSPDDAVAAKKAGFDRFLPKPIRKAELRQTICNIWAAMREQEEGPISDPLLTGQVLVVEDNPVNQEVIGQMLRSLGLRVQMASGAMHGLRSLCEAHFDLVLMDIMMPGMDGVEAVSWFRRGSGARFQFKTPTHTPVIAVTANALEGDEERFLSLGFNDYLSKPFRQKQLLAMLTKYLRPNLSAPQSPGSSGGHGVAPTTLNSGTPAKNISVPSDASVLDRLALDRLRELDPSGQNKLMERVVSAFETSVKRMVPQVQQASLNRDLDGVRHVAHTLKSSSASIGALRLSKMCADLESLIRLQKLDDPSPHVLAICAEVEVVLKALRELGTHA